MCVGRKVGSACLFLKFAIRENSFCASNNACNKRLTFHEIFPS